MKTPSRSGKGLFQDPNSVIQNVRAEVGDVRAETHTNLETRRAEARADRATLRTEARADREALRAELRTDRKHSSDTSSD